MYGLTFFFTISSWFFLVENYSPENALQRGCVYSYYIFLATALFYSYKILTEQFVKILSHIKIKEVTEKWTADDTYDVLGSIIYVLLYWLQLGVALWPTMSSSNNFMLSVCAFVLMSLAITQLQFYFIINGIMNNVRQHMG